jgi:hypothetical protein
MCRLFVTKHGFTISTSDVDAEQWTAMDSSRQQCKVSFAFEFSHTIVDVRYQDEEEMYGCPTTAPLHRAFPEVKTKLRP